MTWTLVTGGAKRLGAEICRTLAAKGHQIVVHYQNSRQDAVDVVKACRQLAGKAECIAGDFSTRETTEQFVKDFLRHFPDTINLVNNVGNYVISPALETSISDWYNLFQTNLHAAFILIQALAPSIKRHQGNIINVGVVGVQNLRADTYSTAYSMTKTGLWMLTKSLARELAPFSVRVNMVSPGHLDNAIDPLDSAAIPMRRSGSSHEVARVIAFLLERDSEYITGQNIEIAGGLRL